VLEAFCEGAGGRMASTDALALESGSAAFYGVRSAWNRLWMQAKADGRDWFYLDNAWRDADRELKFRVARNRVQQLVPDPGREIEVAPWRKDGDHIVICPQSDEYMRVVAGSFGDWAWDVSVQLRKYTTRELRVRRKGTPRKLADDLRGAWACVVYTSCAAIEALAVGIPIICAEACVAAPFSGTFDAIERPAMPPGRERFMGRVEASQWTLDEMRSGDAWRAITA